MYTYWGNAVSVPPGPDPVSPLGGASEIEGAVNQNNVDFQKRLNSLGIPAYFDPYGPGTHTWAYWTRDLRWSIGRIMSDFAHPAPNPSQFTYTSADDQYAVYGWSVAMHRSAREFSTLAGVSCQGSSLSGRGAGALTTGRCYTPGARYVVTMTGPGSESSATGVAGSGRLLAL